MTSSVKPAIVGKCPEVEVAIKGVRVPCVLDTCSQVTLFSQSFFQRYLGGELLQDAGDISWLSLKAANGLQIPYVGYAVVDFLIGGVEVKEKGVLVVKDDCINANYGLLGMNVISDCWEGLFQNGHPGPTAFKSTVSPAAGAAWEKAFTVCQRVNTAAPLTVLTGVAKLQRQAPVVIPPPGGDDPLDPRPPRE